MSHQSLSEFIRPESLLTICDIGASYLQTPEYDGLIKNKVASLIGFEPNVQECDRLKEIYGPPHTFYPEFVGIGGPATFYETNWFPTGSLFKGNANVLQRYSGLWECTTPVAEHPVNTVALDALLTGQTIDYMKIDVQGGELDVFKGARQHMNHVLAIHAEVWFVDVYQNQPLFSDVDQYLRNLGFGLVKFIGPRACTLRPVLLNNNPNLGHQLIWTDALYMRAMDALDHYSDDQLIKLATLAHDVYGMTDFAYRFLAELDRRRKTSLGVDYITRTTSNASP